MSLQKTIEIKGGVSVTDAYIKIDLIKQYNGGLLTIVVKTYKDSTYKDAGDMIEQLVYSVKYDDADYATYFAEDVVKLVGNSLLSQAYVYLKTQTLFENATDI